MTVSKRPAFTSLFFLLSLAGCGTMVRQAVIAYIAVDSKLSPKHVSIDIDREFIERFQHRVTIHTIFTVDKAMSAPLPPPLDGDLHFSGRAPQVALPIVAEIASAGEEKSAIDLVKNAAGAHQALQVPAIWRIWPEPAGRSKEEQGKP